MIDNFYPICGLVNYAGVNPTQRTMNTWKHHSPRVFFRRNSKKKVFCCEIKFFGFLDGLVTKYVIQKLVITEIISLLSNKAAKLYYLIWYLSGDTTFPAFIIFLTYQFRVNTNFKCLLVIYSEYFFRYSLSSRCEGHKFFHDFPSHFNSDITGDISTPYFIH